MQGPAGVTPTEYRESEICDDHLTRGSMLKNSICTVVIIACTRKEAAVLPNSSLV